MNGLSRLMNPKAHQLMHFGKVHRLSGDYKISEETMKAALEIFERTYGTDHPQVAIALLFLSGAGNYTLQKKLLERALIIFERTNDPQVSTTLGSCTYWIRAVKQDDAKVQINLGFSYLCGINISQDYSQALRYFNQATKQGICEGAFERTVGHYLLPWFHDSPWSWYFPIF